MRKTLEFINRMLNFGKKKSSFRITQADRDWVEDNFKWIILTAGYPEKTNVQYAFVSNHFPNTFKANEFKPEDYFNDCCQLLQLEPGRIDIEYFSDIRDIPDTPYEVQGRTLDSTCINSEDGHRIFLANDVKNHPKAAIYNLTKQLLRIRMFENGWKFDTGADTEYFIIISSVFFRLGLVISLTLSDKGISYIGSWDRKWNTPPEIPEEVMAYSLAAFSKLIFESNPEWTEQLSQKMKDFYTAASELLEKEPIQIASSEELQAIDLINESQEFYASQEFEKAIEFAQKASFLTKDDYTKCNLYNNIGYYLMRLEKFQESIPYFKKALEINPDHAYALDNLGHAYIQLNKLEEGRAFIEKAIDTEYNDSGYSYRNLGLYYHKLNDLQTAKDYFEKAYSVSDGYVDLLDLLYGKLLIDLGQQEEGMQLINSAVEQQEPEAVKFVASMKN